MIGINTAVRVPDEIAARSMNVVYENHANLELERFEPSRRTHPIAIPIDAKAVMDFSRGRISWFCWANLRNVPNGAPFDNAIAMKNATKTIALIANAFEHKTEPI